ncbi:MAG: hypothetical protein VB934_20165 [Polyangiaceae bacterium]
MATPPPQPFGQLPAGVTTAVPQWMPWRARAGIEAQADARERHFRDLRQVSFGSVDSGALWWDRGGHTLFVLRRDGDCQRIYSLDLTREDRNFSEPLGCLAGPNKGWLTESLTGQHQCTGTPEMLNPDCAAFMNGERASRSPDRTRWIFRDARPDAAPRFVIRSLPQGRDTVLPPLGARIGSAAWLADGQHVIVSSNHEATQHPKGPRSIYVMSLDAPTSFSGAPPTTRITFATGDHDHATLSPNGKHIAFVSTRAAGADGPHHVYVARWLTP